MPDNDEEYLDALETMDNMGVEVTDWEAQFMESVLAQLRPLSVKQRAVIQEMREKYGY